MPRNEYFGQFFQGYIQRELRVFFLQICQILHNVCKKEGLTLPTELSKRIAEKSNRNLRRALLMCEACRVQQYVYCPLNLPNLFYFFFFLKLKWIHVSLV